MRGIFVTGTGTEVGKSVVAASICAALRARGKDVAAHKPVVTGVDDQPAGEWPQDHKLLASVASPSEPMEEIAPLRFGPPVSPHLAAELADVPIDPRGLIDAARAAVDGRDLLVCEGIGGLLVPFTTGYTVRDFALDLGLPVVIAASPGLGTINHTLLTIEAAHTGGLDILGVVMTPWPEEPSKMERSNREAVETLGNVPVHGLPETSPDERDLAKAGEALPIDEWMARAEEATVTPGSGLGTAPPAT